MSQTARSTFHDELIKLQTLVIDLAHQVKANGELLLEFLEKGDVTDLSIKIKNKDKEIDQARWQVHDFGDQLIVLQQPVAKDFRQIITSIQITDNLERIGDHFKRTARLVEKATISDIEVPKEIIDMAKLALNILTESISAYSKMFENQELNNISLMDEQVDSIYKDTIKKIVNLIKKSPEDKIESLSKLLFVAQSFERAADHAAKIGQLINFAVTGERDKG